MRINPEFPQLPLPQSPLTPLSPSHPRQRREVPSMPLTLPYSLSFPPSTLSLAPLAFSSSSGALPPLQPLPFSLRRWEHGQQGCIYCWCSSTSASWTTPAVALPFSSLLPSLIWQARAMEADSMVRRLEPMAWWPDPASLQRCSSSSTSWATSVVALPLLSLSIPLWIRQTGEPPSSFINSVVVRCLGEREEGGG